MPVQALLKLGKRIPLHSKWCVHPSHVVFHKFSTRATGLDGLAERAASYYTRGARFAKWRAALQIAEDGSPSSVAIRENAWGLARYARVVQDAGVNIIQCMIID